MKHFIYGKFYRQTCAKFNITDTITAHLSLYYWLENVIIFYIEHFCFVCLFVCLHWTLGWWFRITEISSNSSSAVGVLFFWLFWQKMVYSITMYDYIVMFVVLLHSFYFWFFWLMIMLICSQFWHHPRVGGVVDESSLILFERSDTGCCCRCSEIVFCCLNR